MCTRHPLGLETTALWAEQRFIELWGDHLVMNKLLPTCLLSPYANLCHTINWIPTVHWNAAQALNIGTKIHGSCYIRLNMAVYLNVNADRCGFLRNNNVLLGKAEQQWGSHSLILVKTTLQHELRCENSKFVMVHVYREKNKASISF